MDKAIGWLVQGNQNREVGSPIETKTGRAQGSAIMFWPTVVQTGGAMPAWQLDFCTASLLDLSVERGQYREGVVVRITALAVRGGTIHVRELFTARK
jgi:hypothetical protein